MNKNLEIAKDLRLKNKISINKKIIKFINLTLATINKQNIIDFNILNFITNKIIFNNYLIRFEYE